MKILGLDLGTNSIGWAIVEKEDGKTNLLQKGVRIFQEGVKIEKGVEGSKAAERTGFRSARRIKYRRRLRKIATLKALSEFGYCPKLSTKELDGWRYKKIYPQNNAFQQWWLTDDDSEKTPYFFRNLAITEKMDLAKEKDRYAIGRAFYHMAQRRGFLSNRLEGTKESDGAVKKSIAEISEAKGEKTLGQYFYQKYLKGEKIRDIYTHREAHYLEEFNRICEFQDLPKEFADKVRKAIFYQRPLKSQKGLVGKCVFETNKPRCSVSRPEFEEYRMLCFLNNIKIKTPTDDKLRFLNEDERRKIIPRFYLKREYFDFGDIAKRLAPKKQYKFYKSRNINSGDWLFNYSMSTTVSGSPVSARLRDLFGNNFMDVEFQYVREKDNKPSVIDINDIWHVLFTFDSEQKVQAFSQRRLKLDDNQKKAFNGITLKKDYASLSLKAIRKMLPYLREGLIYSHAVFLANMGEVIPVEVWKDEENKRVIHDEIFNIIQTQNEERHILEIVNGIIKANSNENATWSDEAVELYKSDIVRKLKLYFGKNKFASFSDEKKSRIEGNAFNLLEKQMKKNMGRGEFAKMQRIDDRVKAFISDNFDVQEADLEKIYHPSAIDVYKAPERKKDGRLYLGSPMVSSVRNPMAMRALHQLRKVINELIKNDMIDATTKIHIEMARDLMNANERKAYQGWQRDRQNKRRGYVSKIKEYFGEKYEPSEDEIIKFQFWEEQNHKCLYTGNEIGFSEFLGANPSYDIEHTIPRSLSFDNSQENKTLCENSFNRAIKRNKIPFELSNHDQILVRVEPWRHKFEELEKQIQNAVRQTKGAIDKDSKDRAIQKRHRLSYEKNYWKNKYNRFTMKDVPEGFKNSQLVDTGIITKYSRLYLKTLFDRVYTVKGNIVADFRRMWGLQKEYEKKTRVNHIHHCIDAITIACILKENYEMLAKFYHDWEELHIKGVDQLPKVDKPWETFTEDVKAVENDVLVSHYTPDVLSKQSKKKLRKRGKIQYNKKGEVIYQRGDTVRGSLHKETFYGAIERTVINKKGEEEKQIKYVVRKPLDTLEESVIKNIVDDRVRDIVAKGRQKEKLLKKDIDVLKKKIQKAEESEEAGLIKQIEEIEIQIAQLFSMPNKNGDSVPIKKVRVFHPTVTNPLHIKNQRDKSLKKPKPYKEDFHVVNDGNYLMAIYEGEDDKGKLKRDFEIVNNLEAGELFKCSVQNLLKHQGISRLDGLVSQKKISGKIELQLTALLKIGSMVILWENNREEVWDLSIGDINKRLYKIIGLSEQVIQRKYFYGTIVLRHNKEARQSTDLKVHDGIFKHNEEYIALRKLNHNQFNALVEGVDFKLTPLGEIERL